MVDVAQWLDRESAKAMAFAARRLFAEGVAMVFAVRGPGDAAELSDLPELPVRGIGDADARQLLASSIKGRLDEQVQERIIAETRGNPLALLELPRDLVPSELAGGFGLPDARPLSSRIEKSYHRRLSALPRDTQRPLLAAAAEPTGDAALLWRAMTGDSRPRPVPAPLVTDEEAAEPLYREAVERLGRTRMHLHLGRARLVYGEWPRRRKRRVDAREQLRAATRCSSAAAPGRSPSERGASSRPQARPRARAPGAASTRSPHRRPGSARLAADGRTNPEIGAQLFISPRRVEYHLHKVFAKLDISSRTALRETLRESTLTPVPS